MVELNKIYNENCLTTMGQMEAGALDLVVTSPPYDDLRTYNGYSFDFESVSSELVRCIKPGGVIVWVVGDSTKNGSESGTSFRQALHFMSLGLRLHDTMIFQKLNPVPMTHNRYEQGFEYMFVFSKGKPETFNPLMVPCLGFGEKRIRTFYNKTDTTTPTKIGSSGLIRETKRRANTWGYSVGTGNAKGHPAQFPYLLAKDHVMSWSNPREVVYDPFSGAATVALACKQNQRVYIGSEISEAYWALGNERIQNLLI